MEQATVKAFGAKVAAFALAMVACGMAKATGPVDMTFMPAYLGLSAPFGSLPVRVTVTNLGPAASVMITSGGESYQIAYPLQLKAREVRRFVCYPPVGPTFSPTGDANQNEGKVTFHLTSRPIGEPETKANISDTDYETKIYGSHVRSMLLISSRPSGLKYLNAARTDQQALKSAYLEAFGKVSKEDRTKSGSVRRGQPGISTLSNTVVDSTKEAFASSELTILSISPAKAVDRPRGYQLFSAVFLGKDSDKLSDQAVQALKEYALGGGQLVFEAGNASATTDDRWNGVAPSRPGSSNIGMGSCVLVPNTFERAAFDESPEASVRLLSALYRDVRISSLDQYVRNPETGQPPQMQYGPNYTPSADDPFSAQLPPFNRVLAMLCGYFFMVVPLNILILKKLKRVELTWITAPVLAVVFAGTLFRSADNLYSAPPSNATDGTLVMQAGMDTGMFYGTSDMFFPHSSLVDLQLRDVDEISPRDVSWPGFSRVEEAMPLQVDTGTIQVPALKASNLAFRQFAFNQRVPAKDWFEFEVGEADHGITPITVTNKSPYTISNPVLTAGRLHANYGDLLPGKHVILQVTKIVNRPKDRGTEPMTPDYYLQAAGKVALTGEIQGLRLGPAVGKIVKNRTHIHLLAFSPTNLELPK